MKGYKKVRLCFYKNMHNSKTMHYLVTKVVGKRREDLPLPRLLLFSVLRAILYFWIFINKNNLVEQLPPKVTNTEKRKQSKGYGAWHACQACSLSGVFTSKNYNATDSRSADSSLHAALSN